MDSYDQLVETLSLTMGSAWAAGINLYATVLVLGIGGASGAVSLPETLSVVENPMVIFAAGVMYVVEFFADKVPGVDTAWDGLHTFVRIPAGALLAAGAVGTVDPSWQVAAGLLGGSVSAASHATKSGTRALINTSPEPASNWTASITEDAAVFGGLWLALDHPWIALALIVAFLISLIWLLPKIWRGLQAIARRIRARFRGESAAQQEASAGHASAATGGARDKVAALTHRSEQEPPSGRE